MQFCRNALPEPARGQPYQINSDNNQQRDGKQAGARQAQGKAHPLAEKSAHNAAARARLAVCVQRGGVQHAHAAPGFVLKYVDNTGKQPQKRARKHQLAHQQSGLHKVLPPQCQHH